MYKLKKYSGYTLTYSFLIIMVILTLFPFYWMVYAGTMQQTDLPLFLFSWLPGDNIIPNFSELMDYFSYGFGRIIYNTMFVSIIGTFLSVVINMLMGYGLAKYEFKGKKLIFKLFIVTMFLGSTAGTIASFKLVKSMGLYDTLWALILPSLYSSYNIFLVRQNLADFPDSIIESGRLDGASEFGIFFRLVLPNVRAIVATITLITFMGFWGGYMWNIIVTTNINYTLQPALANIAPTGGLWSLANIKMLGASLSIIPILALFLFTQKSFINSLTGAVKQ